MKNCLLILCLFLCACTAYAPVTIGDGGADATIRALMTEAVSNDHNNIPGIAIDLRSDLKKLDLNDVLGYDANDKKSKLEIDQPFKIASVTKTFVAASILRLHEMDSISIHDPIAKYISQTHQKILSKDGYDVEKITLYHCLNHTSGLYDYAMGGSPYIRIVKENPLKRWTRTGQLEFAIEHGDKLGYPGEKYVYSDTGYVLLGEVIEYFYNNDLALGLRTLIGFEKLGMNHTWLETLEEEPVGVKKQVGRYARGIDALNFDPSIDLYGGGGLVSTVEDLNTFIHALFNGDIFQKKTTLDLMLTAPEYDASYDIYADRRFKDYRLGLWKASIMGNETYIHSGLWGTKIIYQPVTQTSLAINFTKGGSDRLIKKIFMAINNIEN